MSAREFERYLTLRDDRDAGPMAEEVQRVCAHMTELGGPVASSRDDEPLHTGLYLP